MILTLFILGALLGALLAALIARLAHAGPDEFAYRGYRVSITREALGWRVRAVCACHDLRWGCGGMASREMAYTVVTGAIDLMIGDEAEEIWTELVERKIVTREG